MGNRFSFRSSDFGKPRGPFKPAKPIVCGVLDESNINFNSTNTVESPIYKKSCYEKLKNPNFERTIYKTICYCSETIG